MKIFVVVSALLATAAARPGFLHGGLNGVTHIAAAPAISYAAAAPAAVTYSAAAPAHISYAAAPAAVVAPVSVSSQYHAQDELGQYSYGYSGALSAKSEARAFDGSVAGGYSYVDANGVVQSAHYVADPVNGFRVAATNLPVAPAAPEAPAVEAPKPVEDTPEVAEAKAAHAAAVAEAAARAAAAPEEPEPAPVPAAVAVAAPAPAVAVAAPAVAYSAPAALAYSAPAVVAVSPARSFAYHTVAAAPLTYAAHAPVVLASEGLSAEAIAHLRAKAALLGCLLYVMSEWNKVLACTYGTVPAGLPAGTRLRRAGAAPRPLQRRDSRDDVSRGDGEAARGRVGPGQSRPGRQGVARPPAEARPYIRARRASASHRSSASAGHTPPAAHPVMRFLVVIGALLATAAARPGYLHGGLAGVTHISAAPAAISYSAAAPAAISYAAAAPAAISYTAAAPAAISYTAAAPAAVVAPVSISSQYHAQDELGQYNYGYHDGISAKSEVRGIDGSVAGGYSYVDGNGVVQSARYTADAVNGFRVSATNLPVAPAAPEAPALEAPKPVEDTPEVAEAKAAHATAVAEAAARAAAAPEVPEPAAVAVSAPASYAVAAPAIAYSAPAIAYSAPAVAYSAPGVVSVSPARSFAYQTVAAEPLTYAARSPVVLASEALPAEAIAHLRAKAALLG
ncbi:ice-structuring glycoprotein-like [Schistocerca cancellata]|uniref:ice-structuring glycoprotein-like n=1 Tax=Schistocerca cancellata TaxID=274614 RepID=UPI00211799D0|nr:ice-structuring glycoprotein-like [Schistocerca cancellata]